MTTLRGELRTTEPLARYTSWWAGGCAKQLYKPADLSDLLTFFQQLPPDEPVIWLGLGSNTLVREGGIDGTVIVTQGGLNAIGTLAADQIRAEAGVTCPKVARYCARHGLLGLEFFAGIPGTVGGALAMNAGAFGGETWPRVIAVETVDRQGQLHTRTPEEYTYAYRHVEGPRDEWFVAGLFQCEPGDPKASREAIKILLNKRAETQPTGVHSCGSVFRNPPGDHAARLIEAAGLKGKRIGDASVSEKHANFIINHGKATATEIEALIDSVASTVKEQTGIDLSPEVRIIGEKPTA